MNERNNGAITMLVILAFAVPLLAKVQERPNLLSTKSVTIGACVVTPTGLSNPCTQPTAPLRFRASGHTHNESDRK